MRRTGAAASLDCAGREPAGTGSREILHGQGTAGGSSARRKARRLVALAAQLSYWEWQAAVLFPAPEAYLTDADGPPGTYDEFLACTTGPLIREPSARARLTGRHVR